MKVISATEMQNNFGHYLQAVQSGDEVIILKNGTRVARLIPYETSLSYLTDSLTGVLKNDYDEKKMREESENCGSIEENSKLPQLGL